MPNDSILATIQNAIIRSIKEISTAPPYANVTPISAEVKVIDNDSGTRFLCAIIKIPVDIVNTITKRIVSPNGKIFSIP